MFFSAAATGRRTILLTFENTSGSKVRLALPAPPPNRWLVFAHSAVSSARLALDGGPGEELFLIEPECLTGGSVGTGQHRFRELSTYSKPQAVHLNADDLV
jgi:hypothetical protein